MRAMNIAATGMLAQQTNVEVISNNIANMNTTAFNRRRPEFSDLLYQNLQRVGANSSDNNTIVPSGVQLGLGVKTAAVYRITEQGSMTNTDNTLDLAVQGKGYFQIKLPSGVSINSSGQVSIKLDGQVTPTVAGQFQLANFPNDAGLEARGDNLFMETPSSGTPVIANPATTGFGSILQGFLETSNVNVVSEVTNLISAQRAYEMNSKVIQASDEMMSTINQVK